VSLRRALELLRRDKVVDSLLRTLRANQREPEIAMRARTVGIEREGVAIGGDRLIEGAREQASRGFPANGVKPERGLTDRVGLGPLPL
jgi:hypothetical protein